MNTDFKSSFARDLKRVRDQKLKDEVNKIIALVEQARSLREISDVKKLEAEGRYHRIAVGDYRIGVIVEKDTVIFVRFLHRKDIYRYFP